MVNSIAVKNKVNRQYWIEAGDTYYTQHLGPEYRAYQIRNLTRFRDLTANARHIIDIGANVGQNTIEYATWAERVSSFEPVPYVNQFLQQNIAWNKANYVNDLGWYKTSTGWADMDPRAPIDVYPYALSDYDGVNDLLITPTESGHTHLIPLGGTRSKKPRIPITVKRLDDFGFTEVDGIKIDVEGFELPVLRGADATITQWRPIVQTEIVEHQCGRAGYTPQDLCDWFAARDYVRTMNTGRIMPTTYEKVRGTMDSFWIPREKLTSTYNDLFGQS